MFVMQCWRRPALQCTRLTRHISTATGRPPLAFAFDIDGVLIRGPDVLPGTKRTLELLEGQNEFRTKIPYILMTNGGGVSEVDRCAALSKKLGHEIRPSQYIQAHTILRTMAEKYANTPVLVLGGKNDTIRKVAQDYGFKHAYTSLDVKAWRSSVWPFHSSTEAELGTALPVDFSQTPISAIFVFHDPRDWGLDIQVMCDVILSRGIIGGPYAHHLASSEPDTKIQGQAVQPIELVFCNPDLLWRSDFDRPRIGQGGFKEAFQAVFKAITGSTYPYVQYGKPTSATYRFAERLLLDRVGEIAGTSVESLPPVYMIGDNPESDIAGANGAGWSSVLVETGVYDPRDGLPRHQPTHIAAGVEEAVRWALRREYEAGRGGH